MLGGLGLGKLSGVMDPLFIVVMLGRTIATNLRSLEYDPIEDVRLVLTSTRQKEKYSRIAGQIRGLLSERPKDKAITSALEQVLTVMFKVSPSAADYIVRNDLRPQDLREREHGSAVLTGMAVDLQKLVAGEGPESIREQLAGNEVVKILQLDGVMEMLLPELRPSVSSSEVV